MHRTEASPSAVRATGRRLAALSDLQTFGLVMAAGAMALPHLPHLGVLCPMRRITGLPCPLCGSTTAVLHLSQGHPLAAIAANPAAVLLVLCCAGAWLPAAWRAPMTGVVARWRDAVPLGRRRAGVVLVLTALWAWELHRFGRW
jgi:hypothetical protein